MKEPYIYHYLNIIHGSLLSNFTKVFGLPKVTKLGANILCFQLPTTSTIKLSWIPRTLAQTLKNSPRPFFLFYQLYCCYNTFRQIVFSWHPSNPHGKEPFSDVRFVWGCLPLKRCLEWKEFMLVLLPKTAYMCPLLLLHLCLGLKWMTQLLGKSPVRYSMLCGRKVFTTGPRVV